MSPRFEDRLVAEPDLGRPLASSAVAPDVLAGFAVDPADVAFYDRPPPGQLGAVIGRRVALAPEARGTALTARVVQAHELAHLTGSDTEHGADDGARSVLAGRAAPRGGLGAGPLTLRGCSRATTPADRARAALDHFAALSAADQVAFVAANYRSGSYGGVIRTHLEALSAAERTGKYRDTIRRVMELVEQQEARASTGLTDAQMATRQATFMDAEALADAQAATGAVTPPPAAVQAAHQGTVRQLNLPPRPVNRWDGLPPPPNPAQANFRARAAAAITAIVARAAVVAPELKITAAHLNFAPELIDRAADTRFAEYDAGNNRLNFGMDFTDAASADPDFVMGTVVHEVFGHGEHGGIADSFALKIYTAARPSATGALSAADRAGPPSVNEQFGYGYIGTEIYAEMREAQYDKRAPAGVVQGDDSAVDIPHQVKLIKEKFAPTVARGILRGLYARFALDPRITAPALKLFVDAVNAQFPGEKLLDPRP